MIEISPFPIIRNANIYQHLSLLKKWGRAGLLTLFTVLSALSSYAQAPQAINYQAVARNALTGAELMNREIFVVCKIRSNGQNGTILYQEEHTQLLTDAFGLFTFQIGNGEPVAGNFENINWAVNNLWLEIDIDAGDGLETAGAMQFVSVPYALHAATVSDKDDADANSENELITDVSIVNDGTTLQITEAGITHAVELPAGNGEGNPNDELITEFSLAADGNTIVLTEAGVTRTLQLPSDNYIDDDADPENELISNFEYNEATAVLTLTEAGNTWTHDLSNLANNTPDADGDPNNESITAWTETATEYNFTEAGNNYTIDKRDDDFVIGNEHVSNLEVVGGNLSLTQNGGGATFTVPLTDLNLADADGDPNNETITAWTETATEYNFTEAGNNYTIDKRDDDFVIGNEHVSNLEVVGGNLSLTQNGGGATLTVPLTDLNLADADGDPNNETITAWTETATEYNFTEAGNNYTIDKRDDDFVIGNEHVSNLEVVGGNLSLTQNGGGATFTVPLTDLNLADADGDPNNETITAWTETATEYNFTEAGNNYTIDKRDDDFVIGNEHVSNLEVVGGNLRLTQNGGGVTFDVPLSDLNTGDADADATNELQTLQEVLSYNGPLGNDAGGLQITNLAAPTAPADAATKGYIDNYTLVGDVQGSPTATKVTGIQGIEVDGIQPLDGMVLKYNSIQDKWIPALEAVAVGLSSGFTSIGPMDFVGIRQAANARTYNIGVHQDDTRFVTIVEKDKGSYIGAPVHFPHGAVLDNLKVTFKVKKFGLTRSLDIILERQNIATGTLDQLAMVTYIALIDNNILRTETINFGLLPLSTRTVNNELYTYRLVAGISTPDDFGDASVSDIQVHGAVFKYAQ